MTNKTTHRVLGVFTLIMLLIFVIAGVIDGYWQLRSDLLLSIYSLAFLFAVCGGIMWASTRIFD